MRFTTDTDLPIAVLDILPNPVLVKDHETRYVWVNPAFERLFDVARHDLVGRLDIDVFKDRQAAQCNGGDLRVLETGEVDEAYETVYDPELGPRETITRKSRLTMGDAHYLVGVMHDVTEVQATNRRLIETTEQLEEQAQELHRLANADPLTGCLNRRALFASEEDAVADRRGLVMFDLDHFKSINDRYGHGAGDAVLVHFSSVVDRCLREGDRLARFGGEEFVAVLPGATLEQTREAAERIRAAVAAAPADVDGLSIAYTVSIGGVHEEGGSDRGIDRLLVLADNHLYEAKDSGRNRAVVLPAH
ncbi:MAG: GGDEF domain-containing protein [Actinomycetota bacterium]